LSKKKKNKNVYEILKTIKSASKLVNFLCRKTKTTRKITAPQRKPGGMGRLRKPYKI